MPVPTELSVFEAIAQELDTKAWLAEAAIRKDQIIEEILTFSPGIIWGHQDHLLKDFPEDVYPPTADLPSWNTAVLQNMEEMHLRQVRNVLTNYTEINKPEYTS